MGILGPLGPIVGLLVLLSVPAYVVMQALALIRWRGRWLWSAMVPLALMLLAVGTMIQGLRAGSNLAPIVVVFAAPPCVIWLWVAGRLQRA
jgi:hypothetical protein